MAALSDGLQDALGYTFVDASLLERALVHRSAIAEGLGDVSYERLEFLGDAVLGLAVAHHLYSEYPDIDEGEMAKTRATVVGEQVLAGVASRLGVGKALVLGKGEEQSGGRTKPSLLSDALEAIIGAAYLDGGYGVVSHLVVEHWAPLIADHVKAPGGVDYKSRLQERLAADGHQPAYSHTDEGPDHAKSFIVTVSVGGSVVGTGRGTSKKRAEQEAARRALQEL